MPHGVTRKMALSLPVCADREDFQRHKQTVALFAINLPKSGTMLFLGMGFLPQAATKGRRQTHTLQN